MITIREGRDFLRCLVVDSERERAREKGKFCTRKALFRKGMQKGKRRKGEGRFQERREHL